MGQKNQNLYLTSIIPNLFRIANAIELTQLLKAIIKSLCSPP